MKRVFADALRNEKLKPKHGSTPQKERDRLEAVRQIVRFSNSARSPQDVQEAAAAYSRLAKAG